MNNYRSITVVVLLALVACTGVWAQSTAGTVRGMVKDPSGAAVPSAAVTLLNVETRSVRQAQSDENGLYSFPNTFPGKYQLLVEAQGFKKWSGNLELQVQQLAVIDPGMEIGDLAAAVEVRAVTPVIAAESSSIANVTESERIRDMPLNGMDITQLFQLTPGVEAGSYSPHVAGMNPGAAEILQDGGSIVDRMRGGLPRVNLALDTIQEFGVDTNSTAQFSHPATITMVTKSGTNEFHGSVFEKFRNNAAGLRARARQDGNNPDPYKRNEFGASAGGPVRIPGLYNGKDRTFWFFSFQGMRLREYSSTQDIVPTEAMWKGDFSNLDDGAGHPYTIYDPYSTTASGTRTPFTGNMIPSTLGGNKLVSYLSANTPRPTTPANPLAENNYFATSADPASYNSYNFKVNQYIGGKDTLAGRFTIADNNWSGKFGGGPVSPEGQYNSIGEVDKVYNGTITHVHTFSPLLLNELVLSGQRSRSTRGGAREDVKWTNQYLGLSNPLDEYGWPTITGGNGFLWDSENKLPERLNKLMAEDNLTWLHGKHEFKAGFRYANERNNTRGARQGQGRYKYQGDWTALWDPEGQHPMDFTGLGMADMFLGYGSYYRCNYSRPYYYLRQGELGFYAQDSWRVTPRLTLNYGLRWDYWSPYNESANRIFALDMSKWQTATQLISPAGHPAESLGVPPSVLASYAANGLSWTTADKAGYPNNLMNGDKGDFAPRIGAAYKLNSKTVVRGSYGMYYWTVPNSQMLSSQLGSVPLALEYTMMMDWWEVEPGKRVDWYDVFHMPLPGIRVGDPNMIDITSLQSVPKPFGFTPFPRDMRNARVQQWNFTTEREIAPLTSLRLTYTGNHGSNLMQTVQTNGTEPRYYYTLRTGQLPESSDQLRANPFWQELPYRQPVGYSNNNQLQVNLERRSSKGLQYQWYYVFTRALSTSDADEGYASNPGMVAPDSVVLPDGVTNPVPLSERLRLVYSNVAGIPKHQVNWNFIYDLPFGRGKSLGGNASAALNHIIGGWQIASMGGFHTGQWLTPDFNESDPGAWWAINYQMLRDPRLSKSEQQVINYQERRQLLYFAGYFDATGTGLTNYRPALAPPGADGSNNVPVTLSSGETVDVPYVAYNSMPRNFIQGPSNWNADFSLFKNFQIRENMRLRVTADAFNLFNHPNNKDPDLTTGLVDLGVSANAPRIIQFSARFDF